MEYISSDTKNYMPEGHKGFPVFYCKKTKGGRKWQK